MKPLPAALAALAALAGADAFAQTDDDPLAAQARLETILSCQTRATPSEVIALINTLGGKSILGASDRTDGDYTLPNPVEVFGYPVTQISFYPGVNEEGAFDQYRAFLATAPIDTVARIRGVSPDETGVYHQAMDGNDLLLSPAAGGATFVVCASGVRTLAKTLQRGLRRAGDALSEGATALSGAIAPAAPDGDELAPQSNE